jgi:hypothetical protein
MNRSSSLRRAAGSLGLATLLFLPGIATAHEPPTSRHAPVPEIRFGLAGLWEVLARLVPWDRAETSSAREKTGVLIDPNGSDATSDTGIMIDPNGSESTTGSEGDTGIMIDPDG